MSKSNKSLKKLLEEFELIVAWFEQGDIDIEEAVAKFETGTVLADEIKKHLAEAETKIKIVKNKFETDRENKNPTEKET